MIEESVNGGGNGCKKIKKYLKRRLPILNWLPLYTSNDALADFIAGLTVALTVIPQSLAYASLAGLEPQYGLYSSFVGCLIYTIFGTCKEISIGPTALMSLMTYQQVVNRNADFAILLCFLTGIVQLIMAVLKLGVLIDFISIPVTVGFVSASSVIIATSQIKGLLGLKYESNTFRESIKMIVLNIHKTRITDMCLGLTCIIILLWMKMLKDIQIRKQFQKSLWLLSISRNAIVVLLTSVVAYVHETYYQKNNEPLFLLTGKVKSGFPDFQLPFFHTTLGNRTLDFYDMTSELGSSIVLVPIIAVLANVAIAKAFMSGVTIDATQELMTLSFCNIFGSFFQSMPVTGSFSRSAVNHTSGVRTPWGGFYTGLLVILALNILTPYFYYIPKSALAAVIIAAVIFMIEYEVLAPMWKSKRTDVILTMVTFISCLLFEVEMGILIGVLMNIVILLYASARPSVEIEKCQTNSGHEYLLITPTNNLYFPAVEFLRSAMSKATNFEDNKKLPVVINCKNINKSDFTVAKGMVSIFSDFQKLNRPLFFLNSSISMSNKFRNASSSNMNCINNIEDLGTLLTNTNG